METAPQLKDYAGHFPPRGLELLELLGWELTVALVNRFGGGYIHVPTNHLVREHYLLPVIGPEGLEKLVNHYRGENVLVPKMQKAMTAFRNDCIRTDRFKNRMRVEELIQKYRLSYRRIIDICQEDSGKCQIDLFDGL